MVNGESMPKERIIHQFKYKDILVRLIRNLKGEYRIELLAAIQHYSEVDMLNIAENLRNELIKIELIDSGSLHS